MDEDDISDVISFSIFVLLIFASFGGFMIGTIVNPKEHTSDEICSMHVLNVYCIEKCATYNIWFGVTKNYCWFERIDK